MITGNRKICLFALLALLTISTATAAPVFTIGSGFLTVSRLFGPGGEFPLRDIRGIAGLDVSDPGLLGTPLVADNSGGTDPNFGVIPFGITNLNGATPDFTQLIVLSFDLGNATITPNTLTAQAVGSPNGTVTDPALLRLLGTTTWSFYLSALTPIDATTILAQYTLSGVTASVVATPEPASIGLVLLGVAALVRRRRKPFNR